MTTKTELSRSQRYAYRVRITRDIDSSQRLRDEFEREANYYAQSIHSHGRVFGQSWTNNLESKRDKCRTMAAGETALIRELRQELDAMGGPIRKR